MLLVVVCKSKMIQNKNNVKYFHKEWWRVKPRWWDLLRSPDTLPRKKNVLIAMLILFFLLLLWWILLKQFLGPFLLSFVIILFIYLFLFLNDYNLFEKSSQQFIRLNRSTFDFPWLTFLLLAKTIFNLAMCDSPKM